MGKVAFEDEFKGASAVSCDLIVPLLIGAAFQLREFSKFNACPSTVICSFYSRGPDYAARPTNRHYPLNNLDFVPCAEPSLSSRLGKTPLPRREWSGRVMQLLVRRVCAIHRRSIDGQAIAQIYGTQDKGQSCSIARQPWSRGYNGVCRQDCR
jgi:hypothetical protein